MRGTFAQSVLPCSKSLPHSSFAAVGEPHLFTHRDRSRCGIHAAFQRSREGEGSDFSIKSIPTMTGREFALGLAMRTASQAKPTRVKEVRGFPMRGEELKRQRRTLCRRVHVS